MQLNDVMHTQKELLILIPYDSVVYTKTRPRGQISKSYDKWIVVQVGYALRPTSMPSLCMFDKLHLTFNIKSIVSRDIFKNINDCQLTCTFFSKMSPRCHTPSRTCHFNF